LRQLASQDGDEDFMRKVTVGPRQQRVLGEAAYIERVLKERGQDPNVVDNEKFREKYGGTLEQSKLKVEKNERFAKKRAIE